MTSDSESVCTGSSVAVPLIAVVTPVFNGQQHTLRFLRSLFGTGYGNLKVIIVDDGSTDGSSTEIRARFPQVTVLAGDGNLWWAGATNVGVREAQRIGADYVFTVNNDLTVDANIFASLIKVAAARPRAMVGCKIYYADHPDRVWYFGARLDDGIADIRIDSGDDADFQAVRSVPILTGMGVLIPIALFDEVGFYDEVNMPQYFADSDFSLRAGYAGFECLVSPESKIYSDVESSWVNNQLKDPNFRFLWQCLTAKRSPFSFHVRQAFYRRHWGRHWKVTLLRFYLQFVVKFVIKCFLRAYARKHLVFLVPAVRRWRAYRASR